MLQSMTGTLRSTMILAALETCPEGLTRANRRGCMVGPLQFPFGPELIGASLIQISAARQSTQRSRRAPLGPSRAESPGGELKDSKRAIESQRRLRISFPISSGGEIYDDVRSFRTNLGIFWRFNRKRHLPNRSPWCAHSEVWHCRHGVAKGGFF